MPTLNAVKPAVYQELSIEKILPSPYQARKDFDAENLAGLAESMKQEGLLEPILVRKVRDGYELISGERRLRAAKILGWQTIEAKVIVTSNDAEAAAKGMVENLQRQDLNPIEEAEGFVTLSQLDPKKWTQGEIGNISGKDRTYISRSISLLGLPEPIKEGVRRRTLTREHAVELLRLSESAQQLEAFRQIPGRLTREETRQLVDQMLGKKAESPAKKGAREAAKWLADEGFSFSEKDQFVETKAVWDRSKTDLFTYLDKLKAALLIWITQHPYRGEGSPGQTPTFQIPKARRIEDMIAERRRTGIPSGESVDLTGVDPELIRLAKQSPKAIYTRLFGADHQLTKMIGNDTWDEMGVSWQEALKTVLDAKLYPNKI